MQLTPEELVAEFHDAVMELYFARKRIVGLEAENAALKAMLAEAGKCEDGSSEAAEAGSRP